jgi:phage tail-like protein
MARQDPLRGFRYLVEIEGIVSGVFLRVKGLSREVRTEPYREGGVNEYEHKAAHPGDVSRGHSGARTGAR